MPVRVDLDRGTVKRALEAALASLRRTEKAQPNEGIKLLLEKDINQMRVAIDTLSDIK